MNFDQILSGFNITSSGASAERLRMEVVANNIANAFSTRTANGSPYRRQNVLFSAVLGDRIRSNVPGMEAIGGVQVEGIVDDPSDFRRVYDPGHPDADGDGFVAFPNVQLPLEMVNLITANRAYEANIRVARALRQTVEQALAILPR